MGSIQVESVCNQIHPKKDASNLLPTAHPDEDGFRSFKIIGLSADEILSPTGAREEILLLAWLVVLLRTSDGGRISYDWSYSSQSNGHPTETLTNCLSMDEVMTDSVAKSLVGQTAVNIAGRIAASGQQANLAGPISILLSTKSQVTKASGMADEEALQLEIRYSENHLKIRPVWCSDSIQPYTISHRIGSLADIVKMCISNPHASIEDTMRPTPRDLDAIWSWNHLLPSTYKVCMHDLISEQAQVYPSKIGISSWDGSLTYSEIDHYSTFVANSLKEQGVESHDFVPICFEKSRWTIVAVLAAMKAGATFVLMDPTLPLARLRNMATQVSAKTMLSSRKQQDLSSSIIPDGKHLVVELETFQDSESQSSPGLATVSSSTLMYVIFTSGSTGTPKGVQISHETYTSSAIPRAKAVGYTDNSRVLDFASYAFDVSIDSMLLTLGNGGCLCIPSDDDRLNDINGAMRKMQVNYAGLTPSVARILDPDVIASLSGLGLGGEAASARDVNTWGQVTRIVIGYGPCECTIGCTINSSAATGRDYISIGKGNGANMWVVDPNDHEVLLPFGAVGELLVEGPIVGQGYLNDAEKTAKSFIKDPSWLVRGHKNYNGRHGTLYKTGDIGKFDPDGSGNIVFVGRQDTQVKLRGQRVELSEIESQLRARLPSDAIVISEVIVPQESSGQPMLVTFIASRSAKKPDNDELKLVQLPTELRTALLSANTEIGNVLPRYMVPSACIPTSHIPALISGKTDRKRLRQFGSTVNMRQLDQSTTSNPSRELSEIEKRLRVAWGQTLKLEPQNIRHEDNFFALGGDSVAAMQLMSVCRGQALDLTVVGVFNHPTLSAMAGVVHICDSNTRTETLAFSMLSQPVEKACLEASHACGIDPTAIEDIYPCTPTQESLITFSIRSAEEYVAQRVAQIPSEIDIEAWKTAWNEVVAAYPILRTRLAQLQEPGLQQVVVKENISWLYATDLAQYLISDRKEKMELGKSLARYAIITDSHDGKRYMVWTVHHVLYDGWSEPVVLQSVSNALKSRQIEVPTQMRDFVKHVRDIDEAEIQNFWRQELKGAVGIQFPRLPHRDYVATPDTTIEHQVDLDTSSGSPFTMATLIRGAWALVASQYTGSDDVIFGETLTGRDISLSGVESIVGPLIATVPIRVQVHRSTSVESYLQNVQQSVLARTPYQHMGWQNIRKVSRDAQQACEASTGLVIQPEPEYVGSELGFKTGDPVREALHFNPYPLMLAFGIRKGGFRVRANFDSSLIAVSQMKRILEQLEMACSQLTKSSSKSVDEISYIPENELNEIWQWNQSPPLSLEDSTKKLRAGALTKQGSVYPRAVIPWVCDPRNTSLLTPLGCVGELWLEGTYLPGETIDAPAWLRAGTSSYHGRTGRLQSTGDMVQLQEDGSLLFLGRKDNARAVQGGHAGDVVDLEARLTSFLPLKNCAAVAQLGSPRHSNSAEDFGKQGLIVFVEQQHVENEAFELLPVKYDLSSDVSSSEKFVMTICATVSLSLATALKRFDKFAQDSLPSYLIPSAYAVVEKLPTAQGQIDRALLDRLASLISREVLEQVHEGLKKAWTKSSTQTTLTAGETILRAAWAKILGKIPEDIDIEDNFFRLGGDSVLAMKLVSSVRSEGHNLTVSDVFQHMRLGDAAKVFKVNQVSVVKAQSYKAFSTRPHLDVEKLRSKLSNPCWAIQDVYPVTETQAIDVKATVSAPRTSVQYTVLYLDKTVDRERLFRAWSQLVKTHDILRASFIEEHGELLQVVTDQFVAPLTIRAAEKQLEIKVADLCKVEIESDFTLGSEFLRTFFVEGSDGQDCFIIGLSHAQYDGVSLPRLLHDLEILYTGGEVRDFEPFSKYIAKINDKDFQSIAISYWSALLKDSSLSILEGKSGEPGDKSIFQEKVVEISLRPKEITTANLLTAAWSLVLARRLRKTDVTFGGITSGRNIDLQNVENVMGPCYQFTPIRVPFKAQWASMDLLQYVQKQSADSAAHDFLGFETISRNCTQWPTEARLYDSIVHHQDVIEEYTTMSFAGSECKIEISNPHGDAAYPLKAVSYVRGGEVHVGIVGSERDPVFVESVLDDLVVTIEELASGKSDVLLDAHVF